MIRGMLGKKIGMTQIFDSDGNIISVTAVEVGPCVVLETLGPSSRVKIGYEPVKESRLNKPLLGYFKKLGVAPLKVIREFNSSDNKDLKVGQEIKVDLFRAGDYVTVVGTSIGKGFAGGMKRWHWSGGPQTHGHMSHRRPGSIGSNTDPGRVWKGHHMPGHLGVRQATIENLRVMQVDLENNLMLLRGAVPGAKNSYVAINLSHKKKYQSLEEKKAIVKIKRNPMKQSKDAAKGKK